MTENEQKKEYLNQYRNANRKYRLLLEQERGLRLEMQGAKPVEYSDMPIGSGQIDLSTAMAKLDELLSKIEKKKLEMLNIRMDIENRIADVQDGLQGRVLYLRYICLMNWEDICVEIDYSWRQTHRLHSEALKNLKTA